MLFTANVIKIIEVVFGEMEYFNLTSPAVILLLDVPNSAYGVGWEANDGKLRLQAAFSARASTFVKELQTAEAFLMKKKLSFYVH